MIDKRRTCTPVTELKRFFGLYARYKRIIIRDFSSCIALLNDLMKGKRKKEGHPSIKERSVTDLVLASQTNPFDGGIAGVPVQGNGDNERSIAYVSRSLISLRLSSSVLKWEVHILLL